MSETPDLTAIAAANFRGARAKKRWRQADVAERLGVSQSVVSDIEIGQRAIELRELPLICRVFEITLEQLLDGADPADIRALGRLPRID